MTHKQFLLILAVWFAVIALIFATPARSTEIGLVQTNQQLMCDDSIKDLAAATIRAEQLKTMLDGTTDTHARLVLGVEMKAVLILGKQISMWRVENCKDA